MKKIMLIFSILVECNYVHSIWGQRQLGDILLTTDSTESNVSRNETDSTLLITDSNDWQIQIDQEGDTTWLKQVEQKDEIIINPVEATRSLAVVDVPYTASVLPSGAASITVPVESFRTPQGLVPQLTLTYNSMQGNGSLGRGWSMTGLSVISRVNKNLYYNNVTAPLPSVISDYWEGLELDGQRVLMTPEHSYQTEQGQISVIMNTSNGQLSSFTASFPNGLKSEYALTDTINYYVTRTSDYYGNQINYTYEAVGGHYRISTIHYGKNNSACITFNYTTLNSDIPVVYNAGRRIEYPYLLTSITVSYKGEQWRKYNLSYIQRGAYYLLKQILSYYEYSSAEPLVFNYGSSTTKQYLSTTASLQDYQSFSDNGTDISVQSIVWSESGNYNNIIQYKKKLPYLEERRYGTPYIRNEYVATDPIYLNTSIKTDSIRSYTINAGEGFTDIFGMDVDGDGIDEIVKINNTYSNYNSEDVVTMKVLATGNNLQPIERNSYSFSFTSPYMSGGHVSLTPKYYFQGDFNGDGKLELLVACSNNLLGSTSSTVIAIVKLDTGEVIYQGSPFDYHIVPPYQQSLDINRDGPFSDSDKIYTLDYDGDGKTDLCLLDYSGLKAYSFSNVSGNLACSLNNTATYPTRTSITKNDVIVGDFNGDGKHDLLVSPHDPKKDQWDLYTSKSDGSFVNTKLNLCVRNTEHNFFVTDVNMDGQSDLVAVKGSKLFTYFIANGTCTDSLSITLNNKTLYTPSYNQANAEIYPILGVKGDGSVAMLRLENGEGEQTLLSRMTSSFGINTAFYYCDLYNSGNTYTASNDALFPYINVKSGLKICFLKRVYTDDNVLSHISYKYTNAIYHKLGLGFRGFTTVFAYDTHRNEKSENIYDPYTYMVLKRCTSYLSDIQYTYNYYRNGYGFVTLNLTREEINDLVKGVSYRKGYDYDQYGNIISCSIVYSDNSYVLSTLTYNRSTSYGYTLNQLSGVSERTQAGTNFSIERTTYNINPQRQVSGKTTYTRYNKVISSENYTYDINNQLIQKRIRPYNNSALEQTYSYTYDEDGWMTSQTDYMGLTETYTYNRYGQLETITDAAGNTTTRYYNPNGSVYSEFRTDTTYTTNTRSWTDGEYGSLYKTIEYDSSGNTQKTTYYNQLNQVVRTQEWTVDGDDLCTEKEYDEMGRLIKEYLPFRTVRGEYIRYFYDDDTGILYGVEGPNRSEVFEDNGYTTETTLNGITTIKTYNGVGDLLSVEDPTGVTTYTYGQWRVLSSIETPDGSTTSFEYDQYGRRTSITDPSSGVVSTTYDAAGNVATETEANGSTCTYTYDVYNRLTKKTFSGGSETQYTYNTLNQIISVISDNGSQRQYSYDNLQRLSSEIDYAPDNKWLRKNYTYFNGQLATIRYTAQSGYITTEYFKYGIGSLYEAYLLDAQAAASLDLFYPPEGATNRCYQRVSSDEMGLPTTYISGKLKHITAYDKGILSEVKAVWNNSNPPSQPVIFQNLLRSIGYAGNISFMRDSLRNIEEGYSYDILHRLVTYGNKNVTYADNGNIMTKGDVGNYQYSTTHPYAVNGITGNLGTIPLRSQSVTYNAQKRPQSICENGDTATITYNDEGNRVKMMFTHNGITKKVKYYLGDCYEIIQTPTGTREIFYVMGDAYTAEMALVRENGTWNEYYLCHDHLGSITTVVNSAGSVVQDVSYDPWGNLRNPQTHALYTESDMPTLFLERGFTGHEHLPEFGLINMNARLYDPILGRFLSPDPYVQMPENSQSYNRYTYCLNNPLKYVDPDGEVWWISVAIGAAIGAYSGGVMANGGQHNPFKWDYKGATIGYMIGGAVVGGISGYVGGVVANSGIPMANTASIAASSLVSSIGTSFYTGGQMPISMSFGAFSYDFTNGKFGYLWEKGNSGLENTGYFFGALANTSDFVTLIRGGGQTIEVHSEKVANGNIGHSAITGENNQTLVSIGPDGGFEKGNERNIKRIWELSKMSADLNWDTHAGEPGTWTVRLSNISANALKKYARNVSKWNLLLNSCAGHTFRALWMAGVPTLYMFHPHMLNLQLTIRQLGIYASPYIYNFYQ